MDVVVHLNHLAGGGTEEHAEALLAAVEATLAVRSDPIAELSITFTTDEAIAELNQTYLQRPGPTDVLAFRLDDDPVVGDVYISAETASANADRFAVP
ncbi:MAG: rRNA maturation RNase YbeY, partial [Gemmatimonadota bacterium]|nr:rRNA maturation RNase YbeY [Gemmatimonadota bacterium]